MEATTTDIDWNRELVDQLDWHWNHDLRTRLENMIHHDSELCQMRDLYRGRTTTAGSQAVGETAGARS